jgi:protein-L-isoaspartate(D-aspartate) O-methyltransferase
MARSLVCLAFLAGGFAPGGGDEQPPGVAAMLRAIAADARDWQATLGGPALSKAVLDAMGAVPRHEFVPAALCSRAYENNPLPIGYGQTISQPSIVALMAELLRIAPGDTVLEIGTGSGYQAAVLAQLGAVVHSIEIVPELADDAAQRLARLGYDRVTVHVGDGYAGLPRLAPFHAILVTAAPPEVPAALVEQLAPGGRLVLPVGQPHADQQLMVIEKDAAGGTNSRRILPVRFVPLVHG